MGMNDFSGNSNVNGNTGIPNSVGGFPISNPFTSKQSSDVTEKLINYNDKYLNAEPALFRDAVINQTMAVLIGKNKANALLIGPAGVGKTKIAEEIARRIANNDPSIPDKLSDYTIWELPLANIISGASLVGMLEENARAIIDFASDKKNKVILFIDEIHQLIGGHSQTYQTVAQILKPALARGDIKVIGTTTLQESSQLLDDPAFNRRFSRLIVNELTKEQTVTILEKASAGLINHYGKAVEINSGILPTVVDVADQHASSGNHRPDTALTLLDRVCGSTIIKRKEQELALASQPDVLKALKATRITITEQQLRTTALHLMTGNASREAFDVDTLAQQLSRIKGQTSIINRLIDRLKRDNSGLFPRTKPLTFLFAGASGVGKTEVTKIIADVLTGIAPITLNMAEYHSPASINRIIGSPAGYVGSDSNAELPFDILESNPYQIILLDEFEKADRSVQRLFMNAFEEGSITTAKGRNVDFSKAIVVATTNAYHTSGSGEQIGFTSASKTAVEKQRDTVDALSQYFDTELLNRFSAILTFNQLSKEIYTEIVADIYKREVARIKNERSRANIADELDADTLQTIVDETYIPKFGARPAFRAVQEHIESTLL